MFELERFCEGFHDRDDGHDGEAEAEADGHAVEELELGHGDLEDAVAGDIGDEADDAADTWGAADDEAEDEDSEDTWGDEALAFLDDGEDAVTDLGVAEHGGEDDGDDGEDHDGAAAEEHDRILVGVFRDMFLEDIDGEDGGGGVEHGGEGADDGAEEGGEDEADEAGALGQDVAEELGEGGIVFIGDEFFRGGFLSTGGCCGFGAFVMGFDFLGEAGVD